MIKHEASFKAIDESGNVFIVNQHVDLIPAGTLSDPSAVESGLRTLQIRDGRNLIYVSKGKYKIVQTGEILKAMDESAP